jgi:hypothetical protein
MNKSRNPCRSALVAFSPEALGCSRGLRVLRHRQLDATIARSYPLDRANVDPAHESIHRRFRGCAAPNACVPELTRGVGINLDKRLSFLVLPKGA